MKHKFSRIALPAAATVAALALSACAPASPEATDSSSDKPIEITFSSWLRGSEQVVDAFNAAQDEIIVEFQEVASGADNYPQLANQAVAGTIPDVVTVEYARLADVASQGIIADISELGGELVADSFPESVQSLVTFGGKTWSVPLDAGVLQFFYRADLFEQYGIEVPSTWSDYADAAETIAAADPNARIGASIVGDPALYAALSWQHGADWAVAGEKSWKIDIDGKATGDWADEYQQLIDAGLVWTDEAEALQQKQADGRVLSVISGSWYGAVLTQTYPEQTGSWQVATLPAPESGPATAMYGGSSFAVSKNSEQAAAGIEFIEWMTTTAEGIQARIDGGVSTVFPLNEVARDAAADAFDPAFFGGQDVYAVAAEGLANIPDGWTWSPATATTFTALSDATSAVKSGAAPLSSVFAPAQQATVEDLGNRGIAVD